MSGWRLVPEEATGQMIARWAKKDGWRQSLLAAPIFEPTEACIEAICNAIQAPVCEEEARAAIAALIKAAAAL